MLKTKDKRIHVYNSRSFKWRCVKKIKHSPIKNLVITDTIDNSKKINSAKNIEILSISNLLGEALKEFLIRHLYQIYSNNLLVLLNNLG